MASNAKAADTGEAPKKKNPMMMIMIMVVVAAVVFTVVFVVGKKVSAKSKPATAVVERGTMIELDEFLVNLADPGNDHFMKVTIDLEVTKKSGKTTETMKDDVPRVRDAVLTAMGGKLRDDVSTNAGRDKLKADIKSRVNAALGDPIVMNVYFANFVTQ
jgi:flagellar protein FliL